MCPIKFMFFRAYFIKFNSNHFRIYGNLNENFHFFKDLFYFFREKGVRKRGREISMCGCLSCPLLETWPTTQACVLCENQTSNPLVHRPELNPLNYTSQGRKFHFKIQLKWLKTFKWKKGNFLLVQFFLFFRSMKTKF